MPLTAASIMTRHTITARPDSSVSEVAGLLARHDISAVPVCGDDGRLVGMISEGDLLRPFREMHDLRRAWWLGVLSSGVTMAHALAEYIGQDRREAKDLMTPLVVTADETQTLAEIAGLLLRHNIKRLPIVRNGVLAGIVSRADLVRALARERPPLEDPELRLRRAGGDDPAPYVD